MYSSSVEKRWIKLNNRELYEGDSFGDFEVLEITPEQSVLSFDGYEFSLKALQDWSE
ncbi:general secretion pathway protein GspB [Streptomyces galilaeus]|uniref:general secretion pathway protein GspB n=1 Tax=Streptomyces galilaeus TaxID=33899 RepID=UPI0038F5ECE9